MKETDKINYFLGKHLSIYDVADILNIYSLWLERHGYMDTDWKDEDPYAIDEFLKEQRKK